MLKSLSILQTQKGALLLMSIVLLLILTIVTIGFIRVAQLELHGAKNYADRLAGLLTAENILLTAEQDIRNLPDLEASTLADKTGFYESGNTPDPFNKDTWTDGSTGLNSGIITATDGAYYIEIIQTIPVDSGLESVSVIEGGYGEDTTPFSGDMDNLSNHCARSKPIRQWVRHD